MNDREQIIENLSAILNVAGFNIQDEPRVPLAEWNADGPLLRPTKLGMAVYDFAESKQAELDKANAEVEKYISAYKLAHVQAMGNGEAYDIARAELDKANERIAQLEAEQDKRFNEFEHECQLEVEGLNVRIAQLEEALNKYVDTDETYEGGKWETENKFWLDIKRNAQKLFTESSDTWLSEHDKAVEIRVLEDVNNRIYTISTSAQNIVGEMIESRK